MKCTIKCECKCEVTLTDRNIAKLSSFRCPSCNQEIPSAHIEKLKQCFQLMKECERVPRENRSKGIVFDATDPFHITFQP